MIATQVRKYAASASVGHGIRQLGVVGAGQMGVGIALVAARTAGVDVILTDKSDLQLSNGLKFMAQLLEKDVKKEKLSTQEAKDILSRIRTATSIEEMSGVDLAIEAVSEHLPTKEKIFSALATHLSPEAILASNTSSISLSKIAAAAIPIGSNEKTATLESASRVVGFHFFNPVPVMKLVELIPALQTSNSVLERSRAFAIAMGKQVTVSTDTPGFVSNRLLMPFINEAIIALESGIASKEDIDLTLQLGMAHPMGPLRLADFIGLDTCLSIQQTLMEETGDTKYRPSVLLGRMVAAGWLGRKSGKGFYDY